MWRNLASDWYCISSASDQARGFTYLGWIHTRRETESAQKLGPAVAELVAYLATSYIDEYRTKRSGYE